MRIKFFIIFALLYTFANAEKPVVKWAKNAGGFSDDLSQSIAVDLSGNVYVTGYFMSSSITFGSITLNNSNVGEPHVFLAKYDSIGNVLWAKSSGDFDVGYGLSVTVDNSGNAYVSGFFRNSQITFDRFILNNGSGGLYGQLFLTKYDGSGNALWSKTCSNTYASNAMNSVWADNFGYIYATGHFQDSSITFGSFTLTNSASPNQDIFFVKYDTAGNVLWAKNMGGENHDVGNSVNVDLNGNVIISGYFTSSTIYFGSTTLTNKSSGTKDLFVAKYDQSGNLKWAKTAGGSDDDIANSIATDQLGNVYVGGYFKSGSITFGNKSLTNSNPGNLKNFIVKYDTSGNVVWAKSGLNSTKNDAINSLTTDKLGSIYSIGYFDSPLISFDTIQLKNTNSYSQDIFITKQDASGNFLWAKNFGGAADDYGKSVSADTYGNVYLTGQFSSSSVAFDTKTIANKSGSNDIFVAKLTSKLEPKSTIVNYCESDSIVTLTAPDGYATYNWIDSKEILVSSLKKFVVKNPADNTIYTCNMFSSVTNTTDVLHVTIIKYKPKADFSYQNNCKSNTVQFTNLSSKTNGNLVFKWDFGNGNTSTEENPQFVFNNSGLHIVSLEVNNPPATCTAFLSKTIETFSSSLVGIDGDSTYCPGYSTTLKAHGAFSYKWSTGETTDSITINTPGKIWLIGYSSFGCISDTVSKVIRAEPDWKLNIEGKTVICNNDSTILTATGAVIYKWNTGESTPSIVVSTAGIYNVVGLNKRGCEQSKDISVTKDFTPQIDFSISKNTIDNKNNELTCSIPSINDVQYIWDMGDSLSENGPIIKHTYDVSNSKHEYKITLTAITKNGCIYTKSKTIEVIPFIPNVFTPNGDGVNDFFMTDYDLQIIDRYGLTLYKGNKGWDGTYNGKKVDPDTYFYLVTYTDKNHIIKNVKGYITLIR